jgi:hypothetical protein
MATMEGAANVFPDSAQPAADRRILVVNLDTKWEFSLWCRRLALDLYRNRERLEPAPVFEQRGGKGTDRPNGPTATKAPLDAAGVQASNVDFWDVRDVPAQPDAIEAERETDSIWRYWPRPIRGGAKGALAELAEKLSEEIVRGENKQIEPITVLVVTSYEDLRPLRAGEPTPMVEFLDGLQNFFREQTGYRRRIQVIAALNNWSGAAGIPPLRPESDPTQRFDLPDAVLAISRRDMTTATPSEEDLQAFQMKLLRIMVDLFRSDTFANSFGKYADAAGGVSVLRIDTTDYQLFDRIYAATAVAALERKHADAQKDVSSQVAGEVDPFIKTVNVAVAGDDGSPKIVSEVMKDFDKHIFRPTNRDELLIKRRFDALARDDGPKIPPRLLFGHRWAHTPALATWLEQALIGFLQDAQQEIQRKLSGQQSQLATLEGKGVRERIKQVDELPSKLTLDLFGTGSRANKNATEAKKTVDQEIERVKDRISKFWKQFAEQPGSPADLRLPEADIELLRTHCPLIRIEWPDAQTLLTRYGVTRSRLARLMSRPPPWQWIAVCAVICLQIPLLWIGVWGFGHARTSVIPALNLVLWVTVFLAALAGPFVLLKSGHRRVERAFSQLDQAALEILEKIEERLVGIVGYVAIIQRHHFLHRLSERIAGLAKEAAMIEGYLRTVRASLDSEASDAGSANVNAIIEQLQGLPERRQWLDVTLRHLALEPASEMVVYLPGGAPIRAYSQLWRKAVTVRVEPLEPVEP